MTSFELIEIRDQIVLVTNCQNCDEHCDRLGNARQSLELVPKANSKGPQWSTGR